MKKPASRRNEASSKNPWTPHTRQLQAAGSPATRTPRKITPPVTRAWPPMGQGRLPPADFRLF